MDPAEGWPPALPATPPPSASPDELDALPALPVIDAVESDPPVNRWFGLSRRTGAATVTVVIPTLNEAANLPHVLPLIPDWVDEVIIVDGASTDGTPEVARRLLPSARIISEVRRGKGAALQTGFAAASGDIIVALDADGSTDPREIPAFVGLLLSGADFVKGSRFLQGGATDDMEAHRRIGNWFLLQLVRRRFGGRYSDLCYGYNAFWRRVLPVIAGTADGFEIETHMNVRALRAGLRVAEVPSREARRVNGTSNLRSLPDGLRVLRTIAREWTTPPQGAEPPATGTPVARVRIGRRLVRRALPPGPRAPR